MNDKYIPIPLTEYKLLVVDLDGTLLDTEPLHVRSYMQILSVMRSEDTTVDLSEIIGRSGLSIWGYLLKKYKLKADPVKLNELRKLVLFGMLISKDLRAEVIDGVVDLIQRFKGPRVVLTTQDAESANGILAIYELASNFDDVVSAGGDDTRKSKVDSIRALAKKHSVDLSDILWIEDASPEVHEGQNAGISVAIVRHPYNRTNVELADWIIER